MNKTYFSAAIIASFYCLLCTSCQAIATIFKAGMGFGIFLVIGLIMIVMYGIKVLMDSRKN